VEGLGSDTGEVAVEVLPGAGVGGSEVVLDTGEVVVEETPGTGVGGSEVALDAGEVVVEATPETGVGVTLDTGEVVVEETPGTGVGGSEVALDAGEVVVEAMARPGRDGAVEIAVTWREAILRSVGGVTGLLVVFVALLSEGKPWIGPCKMAFRMLNSAGCSAFRRLSSAGVRSCEGKSGERLRRGLLMGESWTLVYWAGWRIALTRSATN
jgi:hypothetical protein